MSNKSRNHVNQTESSLEAITLGLEKSFPKDRVLVIGGVEYTPREYAKQAEAYLAPYRAAREAHNLLSERVQTRDARHPEVARFVENSERFLQGYLGSESTKLRDFGMEPKRKRPAPTGEENAARAAKARATRERNGTLGKKQRKTRGQTPPPTSPPAAHA